MTTPYDIDLNLNTADYVQNAQAALQATNNLNAQLGVLGATAASMNRVLGAVTPGRVMTAGFATTAAAAARFQSQMSGLAATSEVTGANMGRISAGVREIARSFPIGTAGARQMYEALGQVGVAGRGTESTMKSLARTFAQLQGATGESGAFLGTTMVQLDRAFSGGRMDPKRIGAMADSLVAVSKNSGASASSITQFTRAIAPMANAAGIGQNAAMGIAGAFARMGEDGYSSANAMNKMLTDLNRSVREGSSDMKAYANILGTSAENLKAMYQSNPTETITQITEAIGKAGQAGPRMLESLGLEGVRTQRALQGLSASGGLRASVRTAVGATGTGTAEQAAETAFGGLSDSLTKLSSTAGQAGEALGRPLLDPLTKIIDLVSKPINVGRAIVDSQAGQRGLQVGAYGGAAIAMLAIAAGKLLTGSLIAQVLTASPLRGLAGGVMLGRRGNELSAMPTSGTVMGRYGTRIVQADARGENVGAFTRRAIRFGAGVGERIPGAPGAGYGLGTLARAAVFGGQMYSAMATESTRRVTENAQQRAAAPAMLGGSWFRSIRANLSASEDVTKRLVSNAENIRRAAAYQTHTNRMTNLMMATPFAGERMMGAALRYQERREARAPDPNRMIGTREAALRGLAGHVTAPLGMMGYGLARGALGLVGGPAGLATMGLMAGGMFAARRSGQYAEERREAGADAMYGTLNKYLTAMGKATESTLLLSDAMRDAANVQANMASTMSEALNLTEADVAAAANSKDQQVRNFTGTNEQIAAQIMATTQNMSPQVMAANKMDLARQYDPDRVREILGIVGTQQGRGDFQSIIDGLLGSAQQGGSSGLLKGFSELAGGGPSTGPLAAFDGLFKPGARFGPNLGKEQTENVRQMAEYINQRAAQNRETYGNDYALQQQFRDMNEVVAKAVATGDEELVARTTQVFSDQLLEGKRSRTIRIGDLEGTNFIERLAGMEGEVDERLNYLFRQGGDLSGRGVPVEEQISALADSVKEFGNFGKMFDNRSEFADRNRNTLEATVLTEDRAARDRAAREIIDNSLRAGDSLGKVADEALNSANKLGQTSQIYAVAMAVFARVQMANQAMAPQRTTGENMSAQLELFRSMARQQGGSEEAADTRREGEQGVVTTGTAAQDQLKAYLSNYRQFQIQRVRMDRDYATQRLYANNDFLIQMGRQETQYELGISRTTFDHHRSMIRAEEDYHRSRLYAYEDYNLSVRYATEDFQRQQRRSLVDFNRSMAYMAEDAAAAMYDPYERIKVKGVWDAQNLMGNLEEQLRVIREQDQNLARAREMGVSTDVIDLLGLNKAENAQQLGRFIADLSEDPSLVRQFNRNARNREKAAADLVLGPDNKEYRRAREEFNRNRDRMEDDFARMQARQAEAFEKQMSRNAEQFALSIDRANQDFATGMERMSTDYNTAVTNANADFNRQMGRQNHAFNLQLEDMSQDLLVANQEIVAGQEELAEAALAAINGQFVDFEQLTKGRMEGLVDIVRDTMKDIESISSGGGVGAAPWSPSGSSERTAGSGSTIPSAGGGMTKPFKGDAPISQGFMNRSSRYKSGYHTGIDYAVPSGTEIYSTLPGRVAESAYHNAWGHYVLINHGKGRTLRYGHFSKRLVNAGDQVEDGSLIGLSGNTGQTTGPHLHYEARVNGTPVPPGQAQSWLAKGGVVQRATVVGAGEAGPEAIIPLNNAGVEAMAAALNKYASYDVLRSLAPAARRESVVYHGETITYDHSNDFAGAAITVQAQDPDEMARKLEARQRRSNLTKSRPKR